MKNYEEEVDESMTEIFKKENITNYKGIYFKEKENQRYYEANAHFSYKELVKILELYKNSLPPETKEEETTLPKPADGEKLKHSSSKKLGEVEVVTINLFATPVKKLEKKAIPVDKIKVTSNQTSAREKRSSSKLAEKIPSARKENEKIRSRSKTNTSVNKNNLLNTSARENKVQSKQSITNKNPIKIKSVKCNEPSYLKANLRKRSNSASAKSGRDSFCSNSSMNSSQVKSTLKSNVQLVTKASERTISTEKDTKKNSSRNDFSKSQVSTDKTTIATSRKESRNGNNPIDISNKKIYTTINPNHLKKYNNLQSLPGLNKEISSGIQKLTSDFAYGLMNLNQHYIKNCVTDAINEIEKSKSREKNIVKYEKMKTTSKPKLRENQVLSRNGSSSIITKMTSSNTSNSKSTLSKKSVNKFY